MEEWKQNIIYVVLFLVLVLLGGFLDWLHYKYPEMMAPKVKPKKARPGEKKPDRVKKSGSTPFVPVPEKHKIPEPEPEAAPGSGHQEENGGSPGQGQPCPRCGGGYRNFCAGFIFVKYLDGGLGELHQCGMCGKYWDRDVTYDRSRELDTETVNIILSTGSVT